MIIFSSQTLDHSSSNRDYLLIQSFFLSIKSWCVFDICNFYNYIHFKISFDDCDHKNMFKCRIHLCASWHVVSKQFKFLLWIIIVIIVIWRNNICRLRWSFAFFLKFSLILLNLYFWKTRFILTRISHFALLMIESFCYILTSNAIHIKKWNYETFFVISCRESRFLILISFILMLDAFSFIRFSKMLSSKFSQ